MYYFCYFLLTQPFGGYTQHHLVELPLLSTLHNQVDGDVVFEVAVEFDDVLMVEGVHHSNLSAYLLYHIPILNLFLVQLLNGVDFACFLVFDLSNYPE